MTLAHAVVGWCAGHLILLMMFGIGLTIERAPIAPQLRRGVFFRALGVALLTVPLLAFVVATVVPLQARARGLLLLMAASPGLPPALLAVQRQPGNLPLAVALVVVLSLAALVSLPLWLLTAGHGFDFGLYARPSSLLPTVGIAILAPFALGLVVRTVQPRLAQWLHGPIERLLKGAVALVVVGALATGLPDLRILDGWLLLAMLLVVGGSLLLGDLAGAPRVEDRVSIALAVAVGNPLLAMHVAHHSYPELRLLPLLVVFALVRLLALAPFIQWRWRRPRIKPAT